MSRAIGITQCYLSPDKSEHTSLKTQLEVFPLSQYRFSCARKKTDRPKQGWEESRERKRAKRKDVQCLDPTDE